jgi:sugar lactone lactonase YvrE
MKLHRFVVAFAALPLAFVAYACSSDKTDNPPEQDAGGVAPPETPPGEPPANPPGEPPTNPPTPPPPPPTDGGKDAEAGAPTCNGNPLTADGGTPDGGVVVSAGISQIDDEVAARAALGNGHFADGPQFVDFNGGVLVFSSFDQNAQNGKLVRVAPDGGARTEIRDTSTGGGVGIGNAVKGKSILTTIARSSAIWQTLPDGGDGGATFALGATIKDPNDLAVSASGNIYFTDPEYQSGGGTTGVYRIAPAGGAPTMIKTGAANYNGIALSKAGTTLYVSKTDAKTVVKFTVNGDGSVVATENAFVSTIDSPDGLAVDVGDNVWVAEANENAGTANGRVEVFAKDGKKLGELTFANARPTGVAFGGGNDKAVFITTESGTAKTGKAGVFKYTSNCAGLR